jgi:hypothetical protein
MHNTKRSFSCCIMSPIVFSAMLSLSSYAMEGLSEEQSQEESPDKELAKLQDLAKEFGWGGREKESLRRFYSVQLANSREMGHRLVGYRNDTTVALVKLGAEMEQMNKRMEQFEVAAEQKPAKSSSTDRSSRKVSASPSKLHSRSRRKQHTKMTTRERKDAGTDSKYALKNLPNHLEHIKQDQSDDDTDEKPSTGFI